MIDALIEVFDTAAAAPVATRYGVAVLYPPAIHKTGADHTPVADDRKGTWSYWRIGSVTSSATQDFTCAGGAKYTVPLRLVMMLDAGCGINMALLKASGAIRASHKMAKTATGADIVTIGNIAEVTRDVGQQEGIENIPLQRVLVALDITVTLDTSAGCILTCGSDVDILCRLIDKASDAKIIECLGDRVADICGDVPPECTDEEAGATISMAGDADSWGFYSRVDVNDGRGVYILETDTDVWTLIYYEGAFWNLYNEDFSSAYVSLDDAQYPWDTEWVINIVPGPPPPPTVVRTCPTVTGSVTILDQNDNVLEEVPCGDSYRVFVLDSINDEPPYENYIINDNG